MDDGLREMVEEYRSGWKGNTRHELGQKLWLLHDNEAGRRRRRS